MRPRAPKTLNAYLATVAVVGGAVLVLLFAGSGFGFLARGGRELWLLTALVIVGEIFPIVVPRRDAEITTSTTFAYALLIAFGTPAAVLATGITSLVDFARRRAPLRAAFNAGQFTLSFAASGAVLHLLADLRTGHDYPFTDGQVPAILFAGAVFFVVNNLLAGIASALAAEAGIAQHLREDLVFQASTAAVLLGMSPIVILAADFSLALLPLLVLPVAAVYLGGWQAALNDHQALHDGLTGLPNRALLRERAEHALRVGRRGHFPAVMIMDLDRFKEINDTLGHHYGDLLLQAVAPRLQATVRDHATVARLGGDEFAILLPSAPDVETVEEVAARLLRAFEVPFSLRTMTIEIRASIGIACAPQHGTDVDTLMQRADVAMYVAKRSGGGYEVYSVERDQSNPQRLNTVSDLSRGVERGELVVHYQPKVHLARGEVRSVEALVRWEHPDCGTLMPLEFIPVAEQTGLMKPITLAVLDQSLRDCRSWREDGFALEVAVNLSVQSLLDRELPRDIARLLARWGADPSWLRLEVTESTVLGDVGALATLEELRATGIGISIDDFGTGYSSLAYLKQLPVDEVKVDKSFVLGMTTDPNDAVIVRSMIDLGHSLGLRIVGEGVEDLQAWAKLEELGCDIAQGFYISRPLLAEQLVRWLYQPVAGPRSLKARMADPAAAVAVA